MNRKQLHGIRLLTHALALQIEISSNYFKNGVDTKRAIESLDNAVTTLNLMHTVLKEEDEKCEKAK